MHNMRLDRDRAIKLPVRSSAGPLGVKKNENENTNRRN